MDNCGGTGKIVTKKPPGSDANGQILVEETVDVKIPAGVEDGMQLRVSGKGMNQFPMELVETD